MEHEATFGLLATARDLEGSVCSVMCRFCDIFGKEEAAGRKRKQTTNTKFFSTFKCAHYQQHHESQHAEEWKAYQLLSSEQKAVHFDREVFANTMLAHVDSETAMHCLIPKPIIDIILGELLLIDGDEIDGDRRNAIIASFKKPYDANEDTLARFYMMEIKAIAQFRFTVRAVGVGNSFNQVTELALIVREETGSTKLGCLNEDKVSKIVRSCAVLNLSRLSAILDHTWAFALAFDEATHHGASCIDVRLRIYWRGDIHDIHACLVPLMGRHTGEAIHNLVRRLLDGLHPAWEPKLIGCTTDGTASMTGKFSGAVSRFGRGALDKFFRAWCGLHQMAIPVKEAFQAIDEGRWLLQVTSIISHLRRQYTWIAEVGSTCPFLVLTRWLSMGTFTAWIIAKKQSVTEQYAAVQHVSSPSTQWWVITAVVNVITVHINVTVTQMQGQKLSLRRQDNMLQQLVVELGLLTYAEHAVTPAQSYEVGDFSISQENVVKFIRDRGLFVIAKYEELLISPGFIAEDFHREIGVLVCSILDGLYATFPLRNSDNEATYDDIPPTLPQELLQLSGAEFSSLLQAQVARLLASRNQDFVDAIELDHQDMLLRKRTEPAFVAAINEIDPSADFKSAWSLPILKNYSALEEFAGGLAVAFPTTATVESDFSILRWEMNDGRQNASSLSIEGIFQCKSFTKIEEMIG
jgi:hypothetical protein